MRYVTSEDYYEFMMSANVAIDLEYLSEKGEDLDGSTRAAVEYLGEICPHGYVMDILYDDSDDPSPISGGFGQCGMTGIGDERWLVRFTPFELEG